MKQGIGGETRYKFMNNFNMCKVWKFFLGKTYEQILQQILDSGQL